MALKSFCVNMQSSFVINLVVRVDHGTCRSGILAEGPLALGVYEGSGRRGLRKNECNTKPLYEDIKSCRASFRIGDSLVLDMISDIDMHTACRPSPTYIWGTRPLLEGAEVAEKV